MNNKFDFLGLWTGRRTSNRKPGNLTTFLNDLDKDPLSLDERDPVKEREHRRFQQSQEKDGANMSVVMHMVSALQYLTKLLMETVKKIAFDIVLKGYAGF